MPASSMSGFMYPPSLRVPKRTPMQPPVALPAVATRNLGLSGDWNTLIGPAIDDLTAGHAGEPIGQRILVSGRVIDARGRPVPNTLIEIWQANGAGRYIHSGDGWDAPLDPNFTGVGRVVTDEEGRYGYTTIRPGAYPWHAGYSAWRPAHIHLSLLGPTIGERLVTQMYFEGDPLIETDPFANAVPRVARDRLISKFDVAATQANRGLGYIFDVVLDGAGQTPFEDDHDD